MTRSKTTVCRSRFATSRRGFLEMGGLAAFGLASFAGCARRDDEPEAARAAAAAPATRHLEKIGIELYTVRGLLEADMPGTLQRIAGIGYDEVEFAGYFDQKAADVKRYLADTGLQSPSVHVWMEDLRDRMAQTFDYVAEVGHQYVVLGYLPEADRKTLDHYKRNVELFTRAGEEAKKRGLQFGYHNHDFEFERIDGVVPYDLMISQVSPDLMKLTMDLYWIHKAGMNPFEYFEKHPGRFRQCHVKDMGANGEIVDVGTGKIDFARLFAQREQAGFEHFYVEHDEPADPMQTAQSSLKYLRALTF